MTRRRQPATETNRKYVPESNLQPSLSPYGDMISEEARGIILSASRRTSARIDTRQTRNQILARVIRMPEFLRIAVTQMI